MAVGLISWRIGSSGASEFRTTLLRGPHRLYAAVWPQAEETLAARIAAVRGETQPSLDASKNPSTHEASVNTLQLKQAASWAVGESSESYRHRPRKETKFARTTPPGAEFKKGEEIVRHATTT